VKKRAQVAFWLIAGASALASGCGGRADAWNAPVGKPQVIGMQSGVALVDDGAHRVVMLEPGADRELTRKAFAVGHTVVSATVSPDRTSLFVLSVGDLPRKSDKDERPSLTVLTRKLGSPDVAERHVPLATPVSGIAIDPLGKWAALYAGGAARAAFVENPNEIVLVDLQSQDLPVARTIRSFGGKPQRLTFTPVLALPGGPRRLLVIETEQDVTLLDLDHAKDVPPRPEITVRLTNGDSSRALTPGGVAVDDGDPARNDDARIGIRIANDPNVVTLTLAPPSQDEVPGPNDFKPRINLTDVGGPASDIAFVRTDGGLRLAALVPSKSTAVLIEPETSITTTVQLSDPFGRISLITNVVGTSGAGTDVALLYPGDTQKTNGVAFWSLGKTAGQPYRSVEVLSISTPLTRVISVPEPHPELKILESSGNAFYVLDLRTRTASPLDTMGAATLEVSQDGQRLWAFQKNGMNLAGITLDTIHPVPLTLDRPIEAVFDVTRDDGGKSLVAIHERGAIGATVFDALAPDTATARGFSALLLEGL
jgi:hypothetical protein